MRRRARTAASTKSGGEFFVLFKKDGCEEAAVGFGGRNFEDVGGLGPGVQETFDESFGGKSAVQAFGRENEMGLAGGIEFFLGSVAGGEVSVVGLNLAGGCEGADQDFF